MSTERALAPDLAEIRANRTILRAALGVTGSFIIAEAFDWTFTFLGPLFAAQMLLTSPAPLSFKQGIGALLVVALAMVVNMTVTAMFLSSTLCLIAAFLLVLFLTFYAQVRGFPDGAALMLQLGAISIPVLAIVSSAVASDFAATLFKSMVAAVLTTWVAHALFPDPGATSDAKSSPHPPRQDRVEATRFALRNTLILAPMLTWYLLDATQIALVLLVTILMVVRQYDQAIGQRIALGMIVGNLIGGVVASLAYNAVELERTFAAFTLVCLLSSLLFAWAVVRGGARAPILVVGFTTFLLLFGMGISPLPGGSGELFASRIFNVLLATAYAGMALVLFGGRTKAAAERA